MTDQFFFFCTIPVSLIYKRNDAHFVQCYSRLFPDTQCAATVFIIFKGIILDFQ